MSPQRTAIRRAGLGVAAGMLDDSTGLYLDVPLDKESLAEMHPHVDPYYQMFVELVARNRGTMVEHVDRGFGEGADRRRAGCRRAWE